MPTHDYRAIRQWITEQIRAGQPTEALLRAMCDQGWRRDLALSLIAGTMGGTGEAVADTPAASEGDAAQAAVAGSAASPTETAASVPPALQPASEMPAPDLDDRPLYLDLGDRRVSVLSVHEDPQVILFGDFLAKHECERLIEAARLRLQRSMTADQRTGADRIDPIRTSRGMFFLRGENPTVSAIEARIERLLRWPVDRGEGMQVLHYRPGDRYEPHYDYFDPVASGAPALLERGGQRRATLLMYLQEPERGGDTSFPQLGLRFAAKRGCALFFSYDRPLPSSRTLHGGDPVLAGEKWVATKWLRERAFV